ncbi:flagellar protein FlaG [Colwellia sp. D2M02]|uniref:flagellar protein FlaG n=1 Tax=Colwellia sp. D2M02 TaxID=2841562 RepID=UPI001C09C268|nr:flagellar protein FlaG [Colwellia sp. D2M02]MBU2892952.1 flagellar protein FlaG [Colwellia sp. D2M02]
MSIEQISSEQFINVLSGYDKQRNTESIPLKSTENSVNDTSSVSKKTASPSSENIEKTAEDKEESRYSLTSGLNEVEEKEELEKSLEIINQFIPLKNTNLIFEFDDLSDPPIVKVVDKDTDEVIREIPPKNIREISKALNDMADSINRTGALFNSEV